MPESDLSGIVQSHRWVETCGFRRSIRGESITAEGESAGQASRKELFMKQIRSNMAGVVLEFLVQPGETVAVDQDVVMLESMKMQIPIQATASGTVKAVKVNAGDFVDDGDVRSEERRVGKECRSR